MSPNGMTPAAFAVHVWTSVSSCVAAATPDMNNPSTYKSAKHQDRGWANLESPTFESAMNQFKTIINELNELSKDQFEGADVLGFWSTGARMKLANKHCDIHLESTRTGAIFNQLRSIDGVHKWDNELWGALSRAYAVTAAERMIEGTDIRVFVPPVRSEGNIWEAIEQQYLKGALATNPTLYSERLTFFGFTHKSTDEEEPDWTQKTDGFDGVVYVGGDEKAAMDEAARVQALNPVVKPSGTTTTGSTPASTGAASSGKSSV